MAKPVTFGRKARSAKNTGSTSFNFGANVKPQKWKAGSKARKGGKGGGS
jgi:hypothetical protein